MADLNRQLQEYLVQSKAGTSPGAQPTSTTVQIDEPVPVPGSWFGLWSSPWSGRRGGSPSGANSSGTGGFSWPWTAEPDPCLPGMSRRQRFVAFGVCASLSALSFALASLYAPLLLLYARKFALLWSLGSVFAVAAAAVLRGPSRLAAGLSSSPGAALYLCALSGTLYAALSLRSTALTALGASVQVAAIVGYVVTLLPGGSAGIRLLSGVVASALRRTVKGRTMPI